MIYFGTRLKKLRKEKDLTQDELAGILGVTRSTISAYETDALYPSVDALIKIASYFNVSSDFLLGLCDSNKYATGDLTEEQTVIIDMLLEQFRYLNNKNN